MSHVSEPQIPILAAGEDIATLSQAAAPHGTAGLCSFQQSSAASQAPLAQFFHPSKEVLAPGRLISFGTDLS